MVPALTAVLVLLGSLGLGGGTGPPTSAPTGTPVATVPATAAPTTTAPPAPLVNATTYPPLARLGRWDTASSSFQPVAPGSIDARRAVFLSHGWSPGYRSSYDQLQAQSPALVTAWTSGLVNSSGQSVMENFTPLIQAIQADDRDAAVVMFSWVDQSATTNDPLQARNAENATEVNGHRMGIAIQQALAPGFAEAGGEVHLVGHSFGANVATGAALSIDPAPRQLTLLDSPEDTLAQLGGAKNDLRYKLPRLDIGRGPDQTFVDNYISLVGTRYGGYPGLDQVVDVKTQPPDPTDFTAAHGFAIVWYRMSAQDTAAGVGYAWSPLAGADPATDAALGSYYTQPSVTNVLALDEVDGPPPARTGTQLLVGSTPLERADHASTGDQVAVGGDEPEHTSSLTFGTQTSSLWLEFSADVSGRPGDLLTIAVDGRQRYQAVVGEPAVATATTPTTSTDPAVTATPATVAGTATRPEGAAGSFVLLWDLTPGDHVLTVTVGGPTWGAPAAPETRARLRGLRLASTADIQRNLTVQETDALIVAAVLVLLVVVALLIAFLVWVIRRLLRLARRVEHDHRERVSSG